MKSMVLFVWLSMFGASAAFAQTPAAAILSPAPKSAVKAHQQVTGKLNRAGWPAIFVQSPEGTWYAQPPVTALTNMQFAGDAYFGDANGTPRGSLFVLKILVAKDKATAHSIPAGAVKALPDWPASAAEPVFRDVVYSFSGYYWAAGHKGPNLDPGPNLWSDDPSHLWIDKEGMHLNIAKVGNRWACAEMVLNQSLGYGVYTWEFSANVATFDVNAVFGLFTYANSANAQGIPDKEIDFELSQWSKPKNPNAQFVVQPYTSDNAPNIQRFHLAGGSHVHVTVEWRAGLVNAKCNDATGKLLHAWTFKGPGVPVPGHERARANLWLFKGHAPASGQPQEVVVHRFHFTK
jgi:hypothetical protein